MFQGYSRDLHSEVVSAIIETATWQSVRFRSATADSMKEGRGLDRKNPSPTVIGNDFRALGLLIWQRIQAIHANEYAEWRAALDNLVSIRNAVAHSEQTRINDFVATGQLGFAHWQHIRSSLSLLAVAMDTAVRTYLAENTVPHTAALNGADHD